MSLPKFEIALRMLAANPEMHNSNNKYICMYSARILIVHNSNPWFSFVVRCFTLL